MQPQSDNKRKWAALLWDALCCSFELSIQRIKKKYNVFHKNIKQQNCFNIDNNKKCNKMLFLFSLFIYLLKICYLFYWKGSI